MIVAVEEARAKVEQVFRAQGATDREAAVIADVLIEAELRGRPTHGLNRVAGVAKLLAHRPPGAPHVAEERGAVIRIDGADQSGYLVGALMAEEAARVAHSEGHALVGVHNARHCGMLGYYVSRIAEKGLIALAFADCGPFVAPWGAAEAVFGTNPLAAAFPAEPWPILIDMGTCAVTYGALDQARRNGVPAPDNSALDADGKLTTDPNRVTAVLPFGGHRGSALSLLVQLLSGVVPGAAAIPKGGQDYGLFLLVMEPDLFAPHGQYEAGVKELVSRIKSARPRDPDMAVMIPGERCFREREQRLADGIAVTDSQWAELQSLLT